MRLIAIGLAAATLAALAPAMASAADTKDDPKAHAQGMKEAPPLAQQVGLKCTITDAKYLGQAPTKDDAGKPNVSKYYELACQEGLGYAIIAPAGGAPTAFDCLALLANKPAAGQPDKGQLYCRMPVNADPIKALQPTVAKAGLADCTVNNAHWMGVSSNDKFDQYEIACANGRAYVLQVPEAGSTHALTTVDCLKLAADTCKYLPKAQLISQISSWAAPSGRTCQVTDAKWMGAIETTGHNYFELACSEASAGYVLELDAANKYVSSIDCGRAGAIGGGCTLSAAGGQTTEIATYAKLAKDIGYPCTVSQYRSLGTESKTGREVVEYACSDHPDGAIALVPTDKGQSGAYVNCARAELVGQGQKCVLSTEAATNAKLGSEITAKGHSCNVTKSRWVGVTPDGSDYVEVACSGQPGMMLQYSAQAEQLKGITSCLQAKGIGDGCILK
jgi:hypothetical protein